MEDIKIDEIANALRADILNLCHAIGLQGKTDGNDFVAFNPTRADKHLGSFRVCIRGANKVFGPNLLPENAATPSTSSIIAFSEINQTNTTLLSGLNNISALTSTTKAIWRK